MIDRRRCAAVLGSFIVLPGCTLSGTWRAVDYDSGNSQIPIDVMTFNEDQFTATSCTKDEPKTTVGQYRLTVRRLILRPSDGPEQVYRFQRMLGGQIELSPDDKKPRAKVRFKKINKKRPPSRRPG